MGIFTFTDARYKVETPEDEEKYSIGYDHYAKIVLPDDSIIEEEYYNGYGYFGSHDCYEVLYSLNRDMIHEYIPDESALLSQDYMQAALKLLLEGKSDDEISEYIAKNYPVEPGYAKNENEWKRNFGIEIFFSGEKLEHPLKIVATRDPVKYDDLYESVGTQ